MIIFFHLLLDYHVHESTGAQATVSSAIDFPAMASACGYKHVLDSTGTEQNLGDFLGSKAPAFMYIETVRGVPEDLPRPSVKPVDVARRLMKQLGIETPWLSFD